MSLIGVDHNFDFNEEIFTRQFLWKKFTEIHQIFYIGTYIKQLLDEVDHDIMNYQNLVPKLASADNTDMRFW